VKRIWKVNPLIGFAIVLLITGLIAVVGIQSFRAHDRAEQLLMDSLEANIRIDQLFFGVVSMETGLRGYVLTGSTLSLSSYTLGESQCETALMELLSFPGETPAQQTRWLEIRVLLEQWETNWVETGIRIRQEVTEGRVPQQALLNHLIAEREAQEMDAIQARISETKQQVNLLLRERLRQERATNRAAYGVVVWGMGLAVALGLSSGLLLNWANLRKAKQIELQQLLIEGRERERAQLARDLHDGPVQDLILTTFTLQEISQGLHPENTGRLEEVRRSLEAIVASLRTHALSLRSPVLSRFGFVKAVESHLDTFRSAYPELDIRLEADPEDPPLPEAVRETLYRIYQQAMNNIVRHARASQVTVRFQTTGKEAVLEISDDGAGFNPPDDLLSLARNGHLGLVGMREQAEAAGGSLEVSSKPGEGTRLRAVIPLTQDRNVPSTAR